jgi:hypothetical protein
MDSLNISEKIAKAGPQIDGLIERYRNSDTATLKKQDITQIFLSITTVIDTYQSTNKAQVTQFLFSYLRLLNKIICTSTDLFRVHIELENQLSYLRNFILDEITNVEKNSLGVVGVS